MPSADRTAPVRFLTTAYQPDDWLGVFMKSYETGGTAQRMAPRTAITEPRFQAWLRWRNLTRWNVYVSVNAFAPGRRSRARDAVTAIRHVFLEVDHDGTQTLATIAARRDLPPPSYVLHSSPNRVHILWRASGFTIESVEALQRFLAAQLQTDPAATPCTQTTRLPGFFNHKRQQPHLVTIEYQDVGRVYTPADFPMPATAPPAPRQARHRLGRSTNGNVIERARRYLTAIPPAVAGHHGDLHTFRLCCRLVRGFALPDDVALSLLVEWNAGCKPPWPERELLDKLRRARTYGREPVGGLIENAHG